MVFDAAPKCRMALYVPYGTLEVKMNKLLTSSQIRAARGLLRWTAEDLARQSSVSLRTIRRAELAEYETSMTAVNHLAIRHALEAAGVEFIDENGGGPGVRLRKRPQQMSRK
jgi:transcriptional regulator with XRE-family HTH domain